MKILLHGTQNPPASVGLFTIGKDPRKDYGANWAPDIKLISPLAFPTPLGIAEATSYILGKIQIGAEEVQSQEDPLASPYYSRFATLVEAAVLGYLKVETFDLEHDAGNLGQALMKVHMKDPSYRYFNLLYQVNENNQKEYFGGSSPRCLFWYHARRTSDQWNRLQDRIAHDNRRARAKTVLADWKYLLEMNGLWNLSIPWMRGLEAVIGRTPHENGKTYNLHSRSLIGLSLNTWNRDTQKVKNDDLVYFPVYEEDYMRRRLKWMRGFIGPEAHQADSLSVKDNRGETLLRVKMVGFLEGSSKLHRGLGLTTDIFQGEGMLDDATPVNIEHWQKQLQPVINEFMQFDRQVTPEHLTTSPYHYPDILRCLSVSKPSDVGYSVQFFITANRRQWIPSDYPTDRSLFEDPTAPNWGFILQMPQNGKKVSFIEKFNNELVGDLSALGYCLFQYFTRIQRDQERGFWDENGLQGFYDKSSVSLLFADGDMLKINDKVYSKTILIQDSSLQQNLKKNRLATLQRFWRTYSENPDLSDSTGPQRDGARLAKAAAQAFCIWACGAMPLANGRKGNLSIQDALGVKIPFAKDAFDL